MKKILVTGGTGYIGSHVVVELYEAGFEPVIIDNLSNSNPSVLDAIEKIIGKRPAFYKYDLKNKEKLATIFHENEIEAVIHFAASKAVGESVEKPLLYYKNNLLSLIYLLECMKESEVDSFIFSSSCTVYGQPTKLPVTEQSPILPAESPYGNTKQVGEEMLRDFSAAVASFKSIVLRYFNPIGAHQTALIGELPQGIPNNLLPYLLKVVNGELEKLSVFGDDYDTPDGTCVRDYIHVVDLAKAHVIALMRLINKSNKTKDEVFNLGTGRGYSVLDIIHTFEKVTGQKVRHEIASRRDGDIEQIYADTSYANQELGWKAELELEDMLASSWNWQQTLNAKS